MNWLYLWITTQIVAESFPISSSSHVRVIEYLMQRASDVALRALPEHFDELLHIPTLLILALFFRHRWAPALFHIVRTWPIVVPIVLRTAIASSVTVAFYLLCAVTHWNSLLPVQIGLCITVALLFSLCWVPRAPIKINPYVRALCLGLAQSIALLPGVSRMAITYVAGRWLGLSACHAFETSCAIHVPLIIASGVRGAWELINNPFASELLSPYFWLVIIGATGIAYGALAISWGMALRNTFYKFGWYVLAFALIAAV